MAKIKNLLFDLGNVHYAIDFALTQEAFNQLALKYTGQEMDFFQVLPDDLFFPYERGEIDTPTFLAGLREQFCLVPPTRNWPTPGTPC